MTDVLRYAAFTTDPAGGNPAGVVFDADGLGDDEMQQIAFDVGYSETAFASPTTEAGRFRVRYFSPLGEVPFCGHATVATAVALTERHGAGPLVFDTPAGEITVATTRDDHGRFRASLRSVPTHSAPASSEDIDEVLDALGWSAYDLAREYPPHVAFGGNRHLVLAAKTRQRLAKLNYDFESLKDLMSRREWITLQLFWTNDHATVHSRNPFPVGGVVEDPATGAAAAALGGYLRTLGRIKEPTVINIIQGEDMGRRSELQISVDPHDPRVTVTGSAVAIDVR